MPGKGRMTREAQLKGAAAGNAVIRRNRDARKATYLELRAKGLTRSAAADFTGISYSTALRYERLSR